MATYTCLGQLSPPRAGEWGNHSAWWDSASVSAAIANADVIHLVKVPGGTDITRVVVRNPDLDSSTGLTGKIGFVACDGSSLAADYASAAANACVSADGAWGTSAANTEYNLTPPYRLEVDAWLTVTITHAPGGTGGTGTLYGTVEGISLGVK